MADKDGPGPSGGTKVVIGVVAGLVLGAAIMWFFDCFGGGHHRGTVSFRRIRFFNESGKLVKGVTFTPNQGTAQAITTDVMYGKSHALNETSTGWGSSVTSIAVDISYMDGTLKHQTATAPIASGQAIADFSLVFRGAAATPPVQWVAGYLPAGSPDEYRLDWAPGP